MSKIRLDRLLANLGYGSRREVQARCARGEVRLGTEVLRNSDRKLETGPELERELTVSGEPIDPMPGFVLLMNKPTGLSCSHKEEGGLVYDLLPERWRLRDPALTTVGRLDKETSGLLLLSDDGALVHKITSPKAKIPKRYLVGLARPLEGTEADSFASGTLMLRGESAPLLPARLEVHSPRSATIEIVEGRYHQVRRMFAALGNHVETLERISLGGLRLPPDLPPGAFRRLALPELDSVFSGPLTP